MNIFISILDIGTYLLVIYEVDFIMHVCAKIMHASVVLLLTSSSQKRLRFPAPIHEAW